MFVQNTVKVAFAIGLGCVVPACATQSQAFRHMSATEHDAAAQTAAEPTLAAEHTDAAKHLRAQEAAACYGLSESDRDRGPLTRADEITGIQIVRDRGRFPKGPLEPVGVALDLRAEPGVTAQWLGRVVACHMAHVAVVGHDRYPGPLEVPDAEASVSSTGVGFRVTITSHDRDAVRSVVQRGEELASASPGVNASY
jgi:hypothetical protein